MRFVLQKERSRSKTLLVCALFQNGDVALRFSDRKNV